jgi:hypothetical protein
MARKRGREIMRAMVREYPDITILTYRLFSDLITQTHGKGGDKALSWPSLAMVLYLHSSTAG